ncbi:MAG: transcriptional repressor [Deltaproteobacteria bacterium]|nr:transcriptional repressor [Deltaproteobacteria bacterium]
MKQAKKNIFHDYIVREGLKTTQQREIILEFFLSSAKHMSIEELYRELRAKHPNIGYATVCRTLKLFAGSGIAREIHIGDGQTRYEHIADGEHHDHLVCTRCGKIAEFENKTIEKLQAAVADSYGFLIESHKLELYGLCAKCRR